jgi:hypothetical protein
VFPPCPALELPPGALGSPPSEKAIEPLLAKAFVISFKALISPPSSFLEQETKTIVAATNNAVTNPNVTDNLFILHTF